MKNPILSYFCLRRCDEGTPQKTHATGADCERTLCGRGVPHDGCIESLRDAGGKVTCKTCTKVLQARNVKDTYIGPTWFFSGNSYVRDEVVLNHFGWAAPDRTFEHFFAYGHLLPGTLLGVARSLASNDLLGLEEYQTTIYEQWVSNTAQSNEEPHSIKLFGLSEDVDNDVFKLLKSRPIKVTVLRHKAWPLIAPARVSDRREPEYEVKVLIDWYQGAQQLGRLATPHDMEMDSLPGYTVIGLPDGESEQACLAWPTADFEEAMTNLVIQEGLGATQLAIIGGGANAPAELLKGGAAEFVLAAIHKLGPHIPFLELLERYVAITPTSHD